MVKHENCEKVLCNKGRYDAKIGSDCRHFKSTTDNKRLVDPPSYLDRGQQRRRIDYRTSRTPQAEDTPAIWCDGVL